jgi:hypothetical protein
MGDGTPQAQSLAHAHKRYLEFRAWKSCPIKTIDSEWLEIHPTPLVTRAGTLSYCFIDTIERQTERDDSHSTRPGEDDSSAPSIMDISRTVYVNIW